MLKTIVRFLWVFTLLLSACDKAEKSPPEIKLNPETDTVDYNGRFTLSWATRSVDYCIASGDWNGNLKSSGSKNLGPLTRDSLYILDCYYSGKVISDSVAVKVRAPQIPQINLSASPLSIAYQDSTTISWSSQHVTDCIADGDWSGAKPLNGSVLMEGLETDSDFRLTCSGPQGEVRESVSINVLEAGITVPRVTLTAIPANISYNGSTTLSWNTLNADICQASGNWFGSKARNGTETIKQLTRDSHFILSCTVAGKGGGGEGVDAAQVRVSPPPQPVVTLTASPVSASNNGSTTLRWSSSHAESCIATGDWSGTRSISGTRIINGLTKESVFRLNCSGVGGLGSDSVTVTLMDGDT
jgi:trimeric autotransporter adhesin